MHLVIAAFGHQTPAIQWAEAGHPNLPDPLLRNSSDSSPELSSEEELLNIRPVLFRLLSRLELLVSEVSPLLYVLGVGGCLECAVSGLERIKVEASDKLISSLESSSLLSSIISEP